MWEIVERSKLAIRREVNGKLSQNIQISFIIFCTNIRCISKVFDPNENLRFHAKNSQRNKFSLRRRLYFHNKSKLNKSLCLYPRAFSMMILPLKILFFCCFLSRLAGFSFIFMAKSWNLIKVKHFQCGLERVFVDQILTCIDIWSRTREIW